MPDDSNDVNADAGTDSAQCALGVVDELIDSPIVLGALSVSLVIVALGVVGSLLLFIWLSFQNPDKANIVIPLMATAISTIGVANGARIARTIKATIRANRKPIAKPDSSAKCGDVDKQLEADKPGSGQEGNP